MFEDLLGGRYRLESELGHGGMATVWRGLDTRLDRPVAVKILEKSAARADPSAQERFSREAWTVARLTNVHVVRVYDVGVDHDRQYLVMELVEGTNLAALLTSGPLDPKRAVDIAAQVCDALSAAHAVGVVHRDIKPGNILIDEVGTVKICDFGIARLVGGSQATLTRVGTTIGTSQYMAPEQVSGDPVDARTDLYALGCVLYAMLAGAPPFQADTPIAIVHQQLTREPEPIATRRPGLPGPLAALVGRLLAKDPSGRPRSAVEVRAELESLDWAAAPLPAGPNSFARASFARASAPVASHTRAMPAYDDGGYPPPEPPGRSRWPLVAGAAVAVVIIVVVIATLLANGPDKNGGPQAGGSPSAATSAAPTTTTESPSPSSTESEQTGDPVGALRQAIADQAAAGNIDQDAAGEIGGKLDELQQAMQDGKDKKIAEKGAEVVQKLTEARQDGKINDAAWSTIEPLVTQLSASLPAGGNNGKGSGNGDGNGG